MNRQSAASAEDDQAFTADRSSRGTALQDVHSLPKDTKRATATTAVTFSRHGIDHFLL